MQVPGLAGRAVDVVVPVLTREDQVLPQVPQALGRGAREIEVLRAEGAENPDGAAGAGDRHVESPLSACGRERTEVQPERAGLLVPREGEREEDDVALVALNVLEVLHEQRILGTHQRVLHDAHRGLLKLVEDQVPLLGVERDHPDRFARLLA